MRDTPPFPHVRCAENISVPIQWGWVGKLFIMAILSSFGTVAWLSYAQTTQMTITEETQAIDVQLEENITKLDRNMRKLDEQLRIQESQNALMVKQLNRLLQANGVTERIEAPPVKPSNMEPIL